MKTAESVITNFVAEWMKSNWHTIDHKRVEIIASKSATIDVVLKDAQYAMWVLTEVMAWGCEENIYEALKVYEYDSDFKWNNVLKLGDNYVKWRWNFTINRYEYALTNPKEKVITYFE
jgi:hypothetical protein